MSGWGFGDGQESFFSAVMINEVMKCLYINGWEFAAAIDTRKTKHGLNALYFKYITRNTQEPPPAANFFTMSLNRNDRIRMIKASPDLVTAVKSIIPQFWMRGIQEEFPLQDSYEFKLKGYIYELKDCF